MGSTFRVVWVAVAILLLASASAQALRREKHELRKDRRNGDYWIGCIADAPTMTFTDAFAGAFNVGNKRERSCWVAHKRGWWIFHHTTKQYVVKYREISERADDGVGLFSTHVSILKP